LFELVGSTLLALDREQRLHAFDRTSGEALFLEVLSGPLMVPPTGNDQFLFLCSRERIVVIDRASNRRLREIPIQFEPRTTIATNGRTLFVGSWVGLQIHAYDIASGRLAYSFPAGGDPVGRLHLAEVAGDALLLVPTLAGALHAFKVGDLGSPRPKGPAWTFAQTGTGAPRAVVAGDRIVVAEEGTRIYGLDRTGALQWSRSLGGRFRGRPSILGDLVVGRTDRSLVAIELQSGRERWRIDGLPLEPYGVHQGLLMAVDPAGHLLLLNNSDGTIVQAVDGGGRYLVENTLDETIYLATPRGEVAALR
jgi:outer membrane protein assembly factor BamB